MLDVVHLHSCSWRYEFNHKKSHVLIFGPDTCPTRILSLGNNAISTLQDDTHLGVPLSTNTPGMDRAIQHRISNTRGQLYCGLSIGGRFYPIPPTVASKLYWSMIIPRLTYGLELVELSSNSIRALEKRTSVWPNQFRNYLQIQQTLPCYLHQGGGPYQVI